MSAEQSLERGKKYPYDDHTKAEDWAHIAACGVLADLTGRGGVGDELDQCDEDIRIEITQSLAAIIRLAHKEDVKAS
jgi:hypothetical protein